MTEPAWVEHAIWFQVYPLGFVGAFPADPPPAADEHRLRRIVDWLDHAVELGASGIALGPLFASRTHGYDTTDHYRIDPRLGDDADFDHLVAEAHGRGLRVLLDGVFNHVGTDFPRYRDAVENGPDHPGSAWFHARQRFRHVRRARRADRAQPRQPRRRRVHRRRDDPLAESRCRRLAPRRRVRRPDRFWAGAALVRQAFADAWLVGEVIHGDYPTRVRASGFDSVTQYELWKAIWSSLNDGNFHELDWSLQRHNEFLDAFVPMTFIGNHDVTRIASRLENTRHLEHALAILLTAGGTPSVYAGDEAAYRGVKEERFGGDDAVRPEFDSPLNGSRRARPRRVPVTPVPDRPAPPSSVAAHRENLCAAGDEHSVRLPGPPR